MGRTFHVGVQQRRSVECSYCGDDHEEGKRMNRVAWNSDMEFPSSGFYQIVVSFLLVPVRTMPAPPCYINITSQTHNSLGNNICKKQIKKKRICK